MERELLASSLFHELVHILQYDAQWAWNLDYSDDIERLRAKEIAAYQVEIDYLTALADDLQEPYKSKLLFQIGWLKKLQQKYIDKKLP